MGGRGASSGKSAAGAPYGSEYRTVYQSGNIKFVRQNAAKNAKDPLETKSKGRVYVTINDQNEINAINYYDKTGKRFKSINLLHDHPGVKGKHTHLGYYHKENGTRKLTSEEEKLVENVTRIWYHRKNK